MEREREKERDRYKKIEKGTEKSGKDRRTK